jgi:hypothetical protein
MGTSGVEEWGGWRREEEADEGTELLGFVFASATPVFIILLKIVDITKQLSSSATFYSHVTTKI